MDVEKQTFVEVQISHILNFFNALLSVQLCVPTCIALTPFQCRVLMSGCEVTL